MSRLTRTIAWALLLHAGPLFGMHLPSLFQAEGLFLDGFHEEAASIYEMWLSESSDCSSHSDFRQAERHYLFSLLQEGQAAKADERLSRDSLLDPAERELLQAISWMQQGDMESPLALLSNASSAMHHEEKELLALLCSLSSKANAAAEKLLQDRRRKANSPAVSALLDYYFACICLEKGDRETAKKIVHSLCASIPEKYSLLQRECQILLGKISWLEGDSIAAWTQWTRAVQGSRSKEKERILPLMIRVVRKMLKQNELPPKEFQQWVDRAYELMEQPLPQEVRKKTRNDWIQILLLESRQKNEFFLPESVLSLLEEDPGEVAFWRAVWEENSKKSVLLFEQLVAQGWAMDHGPAIYYHLAERYLAMDQEKALAYFSMALQASSPQMEALLDQIEGWTARVLKMADPHLKEQTAKILEPLILQPPFAGHLCFLIGQLTHPPAVGLDDLRKLLAEPSERQNALRWLGILLFEQKHWRESEQMFRQLAQETASTPMAPKALLWASACAENAGMREEARKDRIRIWKEFPLSSVAAQAYFHSYSLTDYGLGDKTAFKHLEQLPLLFPSSPYSILAYYLIGLEYSTLRRGAKGKIVRKPNWLKAIDAFQKGEEAYHACKKEGNLLEIDQNYYRELSQRCMLERALAHRGIVKNSAGTKRQIYLQYAQEILQSLLRSEEILPSLKVEGALALGSFYLMDGQEEKADRMFEQIFQKYPEKGRKELVLYRIWREKAAFSLENREYRKALTYLSHAEEAALPPFLLTEEKLQLWMDRSTCYRLLGQTDLAMQWLSRIINEDLISSLRMQAMFLRAELYEEEGRYELAKKQLVATAEKGGPWSLLAKRKLEETYAYQP